MKQIQLLLLLLLALFLSLHSAVHSDLASERAALVTLRNAVGGRSLLWNQSSSPCSWVGVFCDAAGTTVVELHLPAMGLTGQLPNALGKLPSLQTLSLRFNALTGTVPSDIGNITSLRNLYLQKNFFSGPIPDFLFNLQNLVRLNLAENNFSGTISPGFNNLTRLQTLFLEENSLTGSIPDFTVLPQQFNVSFNNLTGSIPKSVSSSPPSSFLGMPTLCGKPLASCDGNSSNGGGAGGGAGAGGGGKKKLSGGAIAGIVIACIVAFLLILMILICLCRRKGRGREGPKAVEAPRAARVEIPNQKSAGEIANGSSAFGAAAAKSEAKGSETKSLVFFGNAARVFDLDDLLRASAEVLGKGTFGTAYKATLESGLAVAVKRLKDVTVTDKEFKEKIEWVGNMDHENLVALRAYYYSRDEKLIVCDYMPMGSLSALLHGNKVAGRTPLNWETRSNLALGAARGIAYIHSQGSTRSHGNIKSSNILLTNTYEARVSDFGMAHLAGPTPTPNRVDGYRAPEVTDTRKVSQKADVYSFGVLLLELLTGKAPTHSQLNDEGVDLPRWVQSVVKEEWTSEVFDLELLRYQNVEEEMVQLLQLGIDCTAQYPDNRPSMGEVRGRIEELCHNNAHNDNTDEKSSEQAFSVDSGAPPSL